MAQKHQVSVLPNIHFTWIIIDYRLFNYKYSSFLFKILLIHPLHLPPSDSGGRYISTIANKPI